MSIQHDETRNWLLDKYVKLTKVIDRLKTEKNVLRDERNKEAADNARCYTRIAELERELGKYKGYGEVAERLESMSVGTHVKVYVSMTGVDGRDPHVLTVDSLRTSGGITTIHGHI